MEFEFFLKRWNWGQQWFNINPHPLDCIERGSSAQSQWVLMVIGLISKKTNSKTACVIMEKSRKIIEFSPNLLDCRFWKSICKSWSKENLNKNYQGSRSPVELSVQCLQGTRQGVEVQLQEKNFQTVVSKYKLQWITLCQTRCIKNYEMVGLEGGAWGGSHSLVSIHFF